MEATASPNAARLLWPHFISRPLIEPKLYIVANNKNLELEGTLRGDTQLGRRLRQGIQ